MRRILTALVLIPLVAALVLWGPPPLMVAVQTLIALMGVWEFYRLAEAAHFPVIRIPGYLYTIALSLFLSWAAFSRFDFVFRKLRSADITGGDPVAAMSAVALAAVAISTLFLFGFMVFMVAAMRPSRRLSDYLGVVAVSFFGPMYVGLPLALLVWVWMQSDGPFHVLFTLVVIWVGDTAGFFIGSRFGKHKSSPRISPNKTWEGTVASFVSALLVGLITGLYFWGGDGVAEPIVLAALLNIAGQLGDLAESALKRSAGVKDSSQLLPGHGGILDRIDALLFAAPVLWYYWLWKAS
jgi:phosphatidate cytidylyltransferase